MTVAKSPATRTDCETSVDDAGNLAEGAPRQVSSPSRLWVATLVGALASTPLAWLLSYGATLPFFLGIFFFALFGMIVGAVTFRVASPGRPYSKTSVLLATTFLVLFMFGFALVNESRGLPSDIAKKAAKKTADIGSLTGKQYRADVRNEVRRYLVDRYPPGGTIGYVRWVLTNGRFSRGDLPSVRLELTALQTRLTWAVRVVLTLALLAFGLGSQTLGLYQPVDTRKK